MQGQIGSVNGFVVIIFKHYILSDKAVWNERMRWVNAIRGNGYRRWKR
jgi:hypothetical protein